jgi:CRISPR-associated protein Csx10
LAAPTPQLSERLSAFNNAVREAGGDSDRLYFSLTLQSDAVVQDEYFRFLGTVPADMLAFEAGLAPAGLKLIGCFTESHQVSGWNAALRAPKAKVSAIRMGSAFLYSAEGIEEKALRESLTGLEARGIGGRRTEGFGRVRVCDPFHVRARKDYV